MESARVTQLAMTAVKGMRVRPVDAVVLDGIGAVGNRSFYVIDETGEMLNGKDLPTLQAIAPDYDVAAGVLTLTFPDGTAVAAEVAYGATIETRFFSDPVDARELAGPWAAALSEHFGRPLRLADAGASAVDRGPQSTVSLISRGSLRRLAEVAGRDGIDGRRFRMLIEIDGVPAHAEDRWVGGRVRVGDALLEMHGHVGRCVVTNRDPDTGVSDLMTLKALGRYRRDEDSTEPLPFGVYGEIITPATVRVGDPVALDG